MAKEVGEDEIPQFLSAPKAMELEEGDNFEFSKF